MRTSLLCGIAAVALAGAASARPVVTLTFEGINGPTNATTTVGGFYNGGTSGAGQTGPNFGVGFSSNALAIVDADVPGGGGNFANEPTGDTILFFLTGNETFMNVPAGFDTGFSFFYSSVNQAGSVNVYDGPNGTGNVLASINLVALGSDPNGGDPTGAFNRWRPVGVAFAGTAFSVGFGGVANQIGFDNVTFGRDTPGGVIPLPSAAGLGFAGLLAVGAGRRRR